MSNYHICNMRDEIDSGLGDPTILHRMEKKRIKAVGSTKVNAATHTTTASQSSAKLSVISTAEGKSVVSSLSVELKDSIRYMARKVAPFPIPAGQNTVIHLDNYTHFMQQRVTTTKTIKRAEVISETYNNSIAPFTTSGSNSSVTGSDIMDVDLKVILGGSSYQPKNNKAFNTNIEEMQDLKSVAPSKKRVGNSSESKEVNKTNKLADINVDKPNTSTMLTPILKKTKPNSLKKIIKNRRGKKTKLKAKSGPKSSVISRDTGEQKTNALQISQSTASKSEQKILRPCVYTLQSKKCLSELTCPYLHSDFPCKYYYLNIPCPQDIKCQFMHNGPLRPDLKDALRDHILDLLSSKPSTLETHFVEQMHRIEDLSHRLYSLHNVHGDQEEVIEIMDDLDGSLTLIVDESSNEYTIDNITPASILSNNVSENTELDVVFKNIKATNTAVDHIDKKLKFLKTSDMPPNAKINELQNIYDLLKEQEKRLKVYESLNNLSPSADNGQTAAANVTIPQAVNEVEISESPENVLNSEDDNFMTTTELECSQAANSDTPKAFGNRLLINKEENISDEERTSPIIEKESLRVPNCNADGVEIISVETLPQSYSGGHNAKTSYSKGLATNDLHLPSNINTKTNEHRNKIKELTYEAKQLEFENKDFNLLSEGIEIETTNNENEVEETSSPYEHQLATKLGKRHGRYLRSHSLQDNEESTNKNDREKSPTVTTKPFRSRRLRLPKPSRKIIDEEHIDEEALVQAVEVPSTQNVILTKCFLEKAKQKLDEQSILHEKQETDCSNHRLKANVEENMFAMHSVDPIESNESNNTLNLSQNLLTDEGVCSNSENPTLNENIDKETINVSNLRSNIPFEKPTSSSTSTDKFHLGNPHVVLTKLKTPFVPQTTQEDINADSTTSYPIVTSSTLSADNKLKQKRCCYLDERGVNSTLKASKKIRMDNSKSSGKVKIDNRKRTVSQQSLSSEDSDFASSYSNNKQAKAFETSSAHKQQQNRTHHSEDEELLDLHQQIENANNKSDLQLHFQQHERQQEGEQKLKCISTTTATGFVAGKRQNLQHKQYQRHEKLTAEEKANAKDLQQHKGQHDGNELEEGEIINTCSSYDTAERDEDERGQFSGFERTSKPEELTSSSNKYSNAIAPVEEENISTYSLLSNKLEHHSNNLEKSSDDISPISSPTYATDTIASPSPIRINSFNFCMGSEIDGSLTYPPIPYILHEIELPKIEVNKPQFIDKLKKTIQLDPRIFKTHIKKQSISFCKSVETTSSAITNSNTFNLTNDSLSFGRSTTTAATTTTMISPYDPRIRTSALEMDVTAASSLSQQTALTPYNSVQTVAASTSSASSASTSSLISSFFHTGIPTAVPIALQYHSSSQTIVQPQQQQTPNMFLYGCLQRSSWYQSLMSTMKIQINQSISQLIRALNNFHRERQFNPEIVFDLFKIDCAGELFEIMRNLGIFVDANGVINEQRPDPSFAARSTCNEMPVNATYSLIQQFLTPHAHCPSLTEPSSSYSSTGGDRLNANESMLSCYVKAPETVPKNSDDSATGYKSKQNDKRNCNSNSDSDYYNSSNKRNENKNDTYNNQTNSSRRYGSSVKKQYDNNKGNSNYQQRSSERSSYNGSNSYKNNPRFMKPGAGSPIRANTSSSPTHSPKESDGGSGGGRFNNFGNKRRFNNYDNNDNGNGRSSWSSSHPKENRYSNKYQGNNSPSHDFVSNSPFHSPRSTESKTVSPPPPPPQKPLAPKNLSDEEECWDSD